MLHKLFRLISAALLFSTPLHLHAASDRTAVGERTALDRYVHAPDTNYSYRVASTIEGEGYTAYMIDLVSQAWLTTNEVERPLWQHWLTLVKPDKVSSSTGMLFITGGRHRKEPPAKAETNIVLVAKETETVVAQLSNVPNQPTVFAGETKGRTED